MDKNDILDYVTETPGNTNRAVLGSMLDSVGGTDLPAVTSDDNGKVLTVVDGTWDKAENTSGSDLFIVTFLSSTTVDKSYSEIYSAYQAGKIIAFNYSGTLTFASFLQNGMERFESCIISVEELDEGHWDAKYATRLVVWVNGASVTSGNI